MTYTISVVINFLEEAGLSFFSPFFPVSWKTSFTHVTEK